MVCKTYETFPLNKPLIPTLYLADMLSLIINENSFQFNGKSHLQTHGSAMETKMAVSFANIFMAAIETESINRGHFKPVTWKRYINDAFSVWNISKEETMEHKQRGNKLK